MKPTNYKLSLIYFSYRPGGFDMLTQSLAKQTYDNYELIVVDDMPDRNLTEYIKGYNIPLTYYGPSKKKCYPDTPFGQVNAINTGLLKATGDITILIEDYAWLRPKTLERWCEIFDEKGPTTLISGVGEYWRYKQPEKIDSISVWNPPFNGDFSTCTHTGTWKPDEFEFFYSGISMPAWESLNGMDERVDYWRTWSVLVWMNICKVAGLNFYVDTKNVIDLIDHRKWTMKDESLWWINNTYKGRQPKEPHEIIWNTVAPNCFNLKELHQKCLHTQPEQGDSVMSNLSYEYRKNLYTIDLLFGKENDYDNPERGNYWKRRLKGCILAAVGYALGIPRYEDIIEADPQYMKDGETYEKQMATLLSKATRIPRLVFEVGSGRGELAAALTTFEIPCIASDLMPSFEESLRITEKLWGAKVNGICADIIQASRVMREVKPDTVILCETIEHIPRDEFEEAWVNIVETLRETGGLFIATNWLSYHPIYPNGNEHIWEINDAVYDWLASYAKKTIYRKGSHLVLQF